MISIDSRSSKPIYEQIIDEIKENILKGILRPGDKLPSVRELSGIIMANPNTISKAYTELERQRVIETIRGRGTYVSMEYKPRSDEERLNKFKQSMKGLIVEGHYLGLKKEDVMKIMELIYADIERE